MKVTLKADHSHGDVQYPKGATIDVPLHDALWLKTLDLVDESLAAIGTEVKKLDAKAQGAYGDALDRAAAAEASRKADKAPDNVTPIKS